MLPRSYEIVLREERHQPLQEAIAAFLEAAKAAEQMDGDKPKGPGAGGTNLVGLIVHSSAVV